MTFYHKRIAPVIWAMLVMAFMAIILFEALGTSEWPLLPFVVLLMLVVLIGYFLMKILTPNIVDEVWDAGDALIVWNRGEEDRLVLSNIIDVSCSEFSGAPFVTLLLKKPSIFGSKIRFCAPFLFEGILRDLRKRIGAHCLSG